MVTAYKRASFVNDEEPQSPEYSSPLDKSSSLSKKQITAILVASPAPKGMPQNSQRSADLPSEDENDVEFEPKRKHGASVLTENLYGNGPIITK